MSTPHVMVDLETFGSTPGSVIASIGAVAFNPHTGEMGAQFHAVINPASCQDHGLTIDADTVLWWFKQSEAARAALAVNPKLTLYSALAEFDAFWRGVGATHFWGHGANFDDPLLAAAYRAGGSAPPWKFYNSRCTRTLFEMAGVKPDRTAGVHHNALDDAIAQARAVIAAYAKLNTPPPPARVPAPLTAVEIAQAWRLLERLGAGGRFIPADERIGCAMQHLAGEGFAGRDEDGFFLTPSGRTVAEKAAA